MSKSYKLRYLPLFEKDLTAVRDYISINLQNPDAAQRLIDETEQAIYKRLDAPLSFEPYRSSRDRKHPYYHIHIRNYMVFYVVIDDVMEVRRFVYSKRNIPELV